MSNNKEIGRIGEAYFEFVCSKKHIPICKACADDYPYDYVIDINNRLLRVQVKTTTSYKNELSIFSTRKAGLKRKGYYNIPYSSKEVDYFFLYNSACNKAFFINKFSDNIYIRKAIGKNNQHKKVILEDSVLFDTVVNNLINSI